MDRSQRRRAEEMLRRLEELDRLDAAYGLGTMPGSQPAPRRARRRWWIGLFVVAALVSAVALHPDAGVAQFRERIGLGPTPVGTPATVASNRGSFAYIATQLDGSTPVAYSPCRPIRYVVNSAGQPEGGRLLLHEAINVISEATGFVFEDAGATQRRPGESVGHAAPVLLAWSDQAEMPGLRGTVAGLGGSTWTEESGVRWFTTGEVVLDRDSFGSLLDAQTPQGYALARAIAVHELGHLVGLDHVDDTSELMHGENLGLTDLGPGDREGLAALGQGPCVG